MTELRKTEVGTEDVAMVALGGVPDGSNSPIRQPSLGAFAARPWTRFLVGALLPWITAVLLASLLLAVVPKAEVLNDHGNLILSSVPWHLTFADFSVRVYRGLTLLPVMLIPPFLLLAAPVNLALRPLARRTALLWRGRVLASIYITVFMVLAGPVVVFYEWVDKYLDNESLTAFCEQWDSTSYGQWSDDPRCGDEHGTWVWALALIPGGGAGFAYWFVKYRPH